MGVPEGGGSALLASVTQIPAALRAQGGTLLHRHEIR
jgi:hypothetical protein